MRVVPWLGIALQTYNISLFLSKTLTIFLFLKPLYMLKVHVVHMVSDKLLDDIFGTRGAYGKWQTTRWQTTRWCFWYKLFDIKFLILTIINFCPYWCLLQFLAIYLFATSFFLSSFFWLCSTAQKVVFLFPFLPLSPVSWVNIYITISKFLNVESREINLHTFLISDSPVNYAFLAVPCLYYVICHSRPAIRDYHQSRFLNGTCLAVWCLA